METWVGTLGHQCVIYLGQSGVPICHSWGGRKCKGRVSSQCHIWLYPECGSFSFLHYDLTFWIFPIYVVSALTPVRLTEVLHYYYSILHVSSLSTDHESVSWLYGFHCFSSEIMFQNSLCPYHSQLTAHNHTHFYLTLHIFWCWYRTVTEYKSLTYYKNDSTACDSSSNVNMHVA